MNSSKHDSQDPAPREKDDVSTPPDQECDRLKEELDAVRREHTLLQQMLDVIPDYIFFKDREHRFIKISRSMARHFQVASERDLLGKTDADFYSSEHAEKARNDEDEIMATGEAREALTEKETWPDRPETWCSTTKEPLRDEEGEIIGTFGIARDITDRVAMQQQLEETKKRLEERIMLLDCLHRVAGVFSLPGLAVEEVLQRVLDMISGGFADSEGIGVKLQLDGQQYRTESWDEAAPSNACGFTLDDGREMRMEVCRPGRPEAAPLFSDVEMEMLKHICQRLERYLQRTSAQQGLAEAVKHYENLVNNLDVGVYRNTPGTDGSFLEANRRMVEMFEADSREAFMQCNVSQFYQHPEQREAFSKKLMASGAVRDEELDLVTLKGRSFTASVTAVRMEDEEGQQYFDGVIEDITQRKQADAQLQLQASALQAAANTIVITDVEGKILYANDAFESLTGYTVEEAIGETTRILKSGKQSNAYYKKLWDKVMNGEVWRGEMVNKRKDGVLYTEDMTITPVADDQGRIIRFIAIKQDISRRKQAEEEMAAIAQELQEKNSMLEDDVNMAREIQLNLLPQIYPTFPPTLPEDQSALRFSHFYQPSGGIGGDFFDVIPVSNTRAGIFICDVMGHGTRAALVTAMMRGMMEELTPVANHPGTFLRELNKDFLSIFQQADREIFATALYLVADIETGTMHYANAGHVSPLHIRRKAGVVDMLGFDQRTRGPALGLVEDVSFPTCQGTLDVDDLIILFTDGLFEVESPGHEQYGDHQLMQFVSRHAGLTAAQLFSSVVEDAQVFSARNDFEDDICLVGMDVARLVNKGT